jgi:hypothetical protein
MGGCGLQRRQLAPGTERSVAGGGCSPPRRPRPTVMNRVVPPPPLRAHTVGTRWRERQWAGGASLRLTGACGLNGSVGRKELVRLIQSMCARLRVRRGRRGAWRPKIHVGSSRRTSVKRYVTRSGKCVQIPPPLLREPRKRGALPFTARPSRKLARPHRGCLDRPISPEREVGRYDFAGASVAFGSGG